MATQMKAPPSTKKEIVDVPFNYRHLVDKYSPGGRYIDAQSDDDSPWVPFGPTAAIKHLSFDVRRNLFSNILWVKGPGTLGVDVGQRDPRARIGHAFGIGEADAAGGAGNQRRAAADVELVEGPRTLAHR